MGAPRPFEDSSDVKWPLWVAVFGRLRVCVCVCVCNTLSKMILDAVLRYTNFLLRARWVGRRALVRLLAFGRRENSFRAFCEIF